MFLQWLVREIASTYLELRWEVEEMGYNPNPYRMRKYTREATRERYEVLVSVLEMYLETHP